MDTHQLETFSELAKKAVGTEVKNIDLNIGEGRTAPLIIIDDGRKAIVAADIISSFEKVQPAPYRRRGIFKAADVKSLLAWMDANTAETGRCLAKVRSSSAQTGRRRSWR